MTDHLTIQLHGRVFSGTFTVAKHFVTVTCGALQKTAVISGMQPRPIARMLLRQLALEQEAHATRAP